MNNFQCIGFVASKPRIQYTKNNILKVDFILSVQSAVRNYNQNVFYKKTNLIPIVVFGKIAKRCAEYLQKGSFIALRGEISNSYYVQGSETIWKLEIVGKAIEFIYKTLDDDEIKERLTEDDEAILSTFDNLYTSKR